MAPQLGIVSGSHSGPFPVSQAALWCLGEGIWGLTASFGSSPWQLQAFQENWQPMDHSFSWGGASPRAWREEFGIPRAALNLRCGQTPGKVKEAPQAAGKSRKIQE